MNVSCGGGRHGRGHRPGHYDTGTPHRATAANSSRPRCHSSRRPTTLASNTGTSFFRNNFDDSMMMSATGDVSVSFRGPAFQDLLKLMRAHHTVLDPTAAILSAMLLARAARGANNLISGSNKVRVRALHEILEQAAFRECHGWRNRGPTRQLVRAPRSDRGSLWAQRRSRHCYQELQGSRSGEIPSSH
jgi:hypothetical protein